MKRLRLLTLGLTLLGGIAFTVSAATNAVIVGMNFQAAIDAATPGDTLVVQPGPYPDATLNFSKPLTVYAADTNGALINFSGAVQVTASGSTTFRQVLFGSTVEITGGGTITFLQTTFAANVTATGSQVIALDDIFNGTVNVAGGKITLKRTRLDQPLTLTKNASLEALRLTMNATLTATATTNVSFLAVQSHFPAGLSLTGYKVWLGYNDSSVGLNMAGCDSVLIGNRIYSPYYPKVVAIGGSLKAYNNLISGGYVGGGAISYSGIHFQGTTADIVNNTISTSSGASYGVLATGISGPVTIRGNIIHVGGSSNPALAAVAVDGPAAQPVFVSYDASFRSGLLISGSAPAPIGCLVEIDPLLNPDSTLSADSPCKNAGPLEAIYNNRDGTRNHMGHTGGPYWNPANYTNNNPMVFFLTGQQTVLNGVTTSIPVNAAAAAGH